MLTLQSVANLTQDMLQKGVIQTMAMTSAVLEEIPFIQVQGNGYSYNIMDTLPEVGYRKVNEGYTPGTAEVKKHTEFLTIMGGFADVDQFDVQVSSNINDVRSIMTQAKATAVAQQFERDFFTGEAEDGKTLKGLEKRLADNVAGVEIKAELTLDALNELLDAVAGGASVLYMSKKMRRQVLSLLQASNHYIENGADAFGRPVAMYGGVKIRAVEDALIPANKIYAVRFDVTTGVHGIQNGSLTAKDLGLLHDRPVYRTLIEWYVGLATKHEKSFAVLNTEGVPMTARKK